MEEDFEYQLSELDLEIISDYDLIPDIIPEDLFQDEEHTDKKTKVKRVQKNYINNADLTQSLIDHRVNLARCQELNLPKPVIPKYIIDCFYKLSEGMSRRPNFASYPFRADLVQDGVENCIRYFLNFDPEQKNDRGFVNPFGYFSRYIWCSFLRRIYKEKKEQYIKYKFHDSNSITEFNESNDAKDGNVQQVEIYDNLYDFIRKFEEAELKKTQKNIKTKKSKICGVEKFLEE